MYDVIIVRGILAHLTFDGSTRHPTDRLAVRE